MEVKEGGDGKHRLPGPLAIRNHSGFRERLRLLTAQDKRGIHMSRLFELITNLHEQPLSRAWVCDILRRMLESHHDISDRAFLDIKFDLLLSRKALLSEKRGWHSYPVRLIAEKVSSWKTGQSKSKSSIPAPAHVRRLFPDKPFKSNLPKIFMPQKTSMSMISTLGLAKRVRWPPLRTRSEARRSVASLSTVAALARISSISR